MQTYDIHDAKTQLSRLVELAARGAMVLALTVVPSASSGQAKAEGDMIDRVPDYVAAIAYNGESKPEASLRHHNGWLRVDRIGESGGYFDGPKFFFQFKRAPDGKRYESLEIRNKFADGSVRTERVKTEKRATYLGETCAIWDLVLPPDDFGRKHVFARDCVTSDGIIVAHGRTDEDGGIREPPIWRLASLTRIAVAEEDVLPPSALFDWRNFTSFAAPPPTPGAQSDVDFVTRMEGRIAVHGAGVRYRKRHFPWVRTDTKFENGVWDVRIDNTQDHAQLLFHAEKQGVFTLLSISEPQTWMRDRGIDAAQQRVIVKSGTFLGEACKITTNSTGERRWTEWLTADGIELKYEANGGRWANPEVWTAVDLKRHAVSLAEVMPPDEIFDRARWGLSR